MLSMEDTKNPIEEEILKYYRALRRDCKGYIFTGRVEKD
jgi:hypothetical protein